MAKIREATLDEYHLDPENAREHTETGKRMLRASLKENLAGRSVLADRERGMIAGNATVEAAREVGIEKVVEVETDGTELVVVLRSDLSPDDPRREALAIYDNRIPEFSRWNQANLDAKWKKGLQAVRFGWDPERIKEQVQRAAEHAKQEIAIAREVEPEKDYPETDGGPEKDLYDQEWEPSARDSQMTHLTFDLTFDDSLIVDQAINLWRVETEETDPARWLVLVAERYARDAG